MSRLSSAQPVLACLLLVATAGAQWGFITNAGPSPRTSPLLGYEVMNNRVLMFGGNWSNEFWSLQNGVWTPLQPANLPPARSRSALAVDELTGVMMLYGGNDGTNQLSMDDTWLWNGSDWTQLVPLGSPGGFSSHAMASGTQ